MANISLCLGSNPCVKPLIFACRSSTDIGSSSGSGPSNTNFYKLLSLSSNKAGTQEIKRAYRTLALKYHPDVSCNQDTTKMFLLLQTAYKTLVDPVSRQEYDCALAVGEPGHVCVGCRVGDRVGERRRWEGQIVELKKRSSFRSERKEGSWGDRIRGCHLRPTYDVIGLWIHLSGFVLRKVPWPITQKCGPENRLNFVALNPILGQKWFNGLRPVWSLNGFKQEVNLADI